MRKRAIAKGRSPAIEKQREKRRLKEAKSFGEFGEKLAYSERRWPTARAPCVASIFERDCCRRGATGF